VERYVEGGVEVVINHLEPYKIKGEPSTLHLEEEFTIDTERDEIVELGLTDIWGFDVDSEENIYFFKPPLSQEKLIYKFNRDGKFITSFGQRGQGPGEIQYASYIRITKNGEIPVIDAYQHKVLFFDKNGNILKETRFEYLNLAGGQIIPLENGNFLVRTVETGIRKIGEPPPEEGDNIFLSIINSEFKIIKVIDVLHLSRQLLETRNPYVMPVYFWEVSDRNIYVGNSQWGYEIRVFDLNGNLLKKIKKKEYKRVKFPKEIKEDYKRMTENPASPLYGIKIAFPDYQPPFWRLFFTDDDGRLFLMTFEKGKNSREYIFDIFNSDGVFIRRIRLDAYIDRYTIVFPLYATAKNNRLYCLREKESGYKELVVYKMKWE